MAKKNTESDLPQKINPKSVLIDELANEVVEKQHRYWVDQQAQYGRNRRDYLAYYESRVEPKPFDWQCNAFLPVIYTSLRTIFPRVKKLIIGKIPAIKLVGSRNSALEKYISRCMRRCKGYLEMCDTLWEAMVYGTGIGKIYWDTDYITVSKQVPKVTPGVDVIKRAVAEQMGIQDETLEYETVYEKKILVDEPVYKWVPLSNFTCNFNESRNIDDADCFEIKDVDLNYLKMRSKDKRINPYGYKWGIYDNIKLIDELEKIEFSDGEDPQADQRAVREEVDLQADRKFNIRLIMAQMDFTYKGTFYRNGIITVAKITTSSNTHNLTIRVQACPRSDGRKNYVRVVYERVPGRFYGRGIPEILKPLQEIIVDFFRAQMDRATLALHPNTFFDVNRVPEPRLLLNRMGGLAPIDGSPNDIIREQNIRPPDPGSWEVLNTLSMFITETGGAHKNLAGTAEGAPNRTATGIQTLMQASTERILDTARDMAEEFIPDVGAAFVCTIKDNLNKKIKFTDLDSKGAQTEVELDGSMIPEDVEIYSPTIFERADREQQAQKMISVLQYVAGIIGEENLNEYLRTFWDLNELPDKEKLFMPSQQSIPLELVAQTLLKMNINPAQFMAIINEQAQSQGGNGSGGGGGEGAPRTPSAQVPAQNQGTQTTMASGAPNTGRMR